MLAAGRSPYRVGFRKLLELCLIQHQGLLTMLAVTCVDIDHERFRVEGYADVEIEFCIEHRIGPHAPDPLRVECSHGPPIAIEGWRFSVHCERKDGEAA